MIFFVFAFEKKNTHQKFRDKGAPCLLSLFSLSFVLSFFPRPCSRSTSKRPHEMDLEAARRALLGAAESLAAAVGRMVAVDSSDDEGIGPRSASTATMEERGGVVGRRRRRRKSKQQQQQQRQPGAAPSPPRVRGSKSDASLSSYYDAVPEDDGDEFDEDDVDGDDDEEGGEDENDDDGDSNDAD